MSLKFQTDHYFHIGRTHLNSGKPCQDHALSRVKDTLAAAVVSDGCSTGRETDMGARVLTFSSLDTIETCWTSTRDISKATPEAINMREDVMVTMAKSVFKLSFEDMLATCLYGYLTAQGGYAHIRGDGVIASGWRDGRLYMSRIEWADNMPLYPFYAHDHYQGFIKAHGGDLTKKRLTHTHCVYDALSNTFMNEEEVELTLAQGIQGITFDYTAEQVLKELRYLALFTDGVTQVEGIDWKDAVVQLMAFKSTAGEFAKRRMIRFIKDSQQQGKGPLDDISYAVIMINNEEEEADNGSSKR